MINKHSTGKKEGRKSLTIHIVKEGQRERGYVVVQSISPRVGVSTVRRKVPKSLRSNPGIMRSVVWM